jgi:hypothetical protein
MFTRRLSLLLVLFGCFAGCQERPPCALSGTWQVEHLGCTDHPNDRPAYVNATYTFNGDHGTTRWVLPGCTVEAAFDLSIDGPRVKLHERQHTCEATPVTSGTEPTPCCTSAPVDIDLSYRCQAGSAGVDWMVTLSDQGDVGPWAGRGAWRGCSAGSLGMMRLVKH